MALFDPAAQSASLDNDYGATKGPNAAASHDLALFAGDPDNGGVEMDSVGGYARVSMPNNGTTWPDAAVDGGKTSAQVTLPTSTDAWTAGGNPAAATHFKLIAGAVGWDSGELSTPISIDQAGQTRAVQITVYYNQLGA